jgi:MoxR-like ATPase
MPTANERPFRPNEVERHPPRAKAGPEAVYVFKDPKVALAVNAALTVNRPLLITGPSGSGKSTLAYVAAQVLKRRYYELVVTGRTEASDLVYRFDMVQRLNDAYDQNVEIKPIAAYIEPSVLWWALAPASAANRGDPDLLEPDHARDPTPCHRDAAAAVVLIDEIDKAEPDVPNDLLVPLGDQRLEVAPLSKTFDPEVLHPPPLVIITSNRERDLPTAFVRRCVCLHVDPFDAVDLVEIAKAHIPAPERQEKDTLLSDIARLIVERAGDKDERWSAAEYLDTVRVCLAFGIPPDLENEEFRELVSLAIDKRLERDEIGS